MPSIRAELRNRARAAFVALRGNVGQAPSTPQAEPSRYGFPRSVATTGVAKGMTPQRIAGLIAEADQGYPARFCELLEEVEDRDAHIVGVMGTRKRAVANLEWRVEPGGDRPQDRKIAEFCTDVLESSDNFEDTLVDLLDAVGKGYAAVEQRWDVGSQAVITGWEYRPQRWLRPDPDNPNLWRVLTDIEPVNGEELQLHGWVTHVSKAKSGFPIQAALGRVLVWLWLFKSYGIKDWVSYSEMFGSPLRVGKFPPTAQKDDIDALYAAVKRLGVDAAAVIPTDMSVEFQTANAVISGGIVYKELLNWCDSAISKAVLGQTLTTEASATGTQALGTVHNDVRGDLIIADAKQLARTVQRDMLEPLVALNFGADAAVPHFLFDTEPEPDQTAEATRQQTRAGVFQSARTLGIKVPVAQVHEELGIREPEGEEEVLTPPSPAAAPAGFPPLFRGRDSVVCPGCGQVHLLKDDGLPATWHQVDDLVGRYLEQLRSAWLSAIAAISEQLRAEGRDPAEAAQVALGSQAVHDALQAYTTALADASLSAELTAEAQLAAGDQPVQLPAEPPREAGAGAWATLLAIAAKAIVERRAQHERRAQQAAQYATLAATQDLAKAAAGVEGDSAASSRQERVDAAAEVSGQSPARTEQVIRQASDNSFGAGRKRALDRQAKVKPYFRYRTRRDNNVRPSHRLMEGKVYAADHPIWQVWTPPNGWNCRCWIEAFQRQEVEDAGWTVETGLPKNPVNGAPVVPDPGFVRDPTREDDHQYDWGAFPTNWRQAIGAPVEEPAP